MKAVDFFSSETVTLPLLTNAQLCEVPNAVVAPRRQVQTTFVLSMAVTIQEEPWRRNEGRWYVLSRANPYLHMLPMGHPSKSVEYRDRNGARPRDDYPPHH